MDTNNAARRALFETVPMIEHNGRPYAVRLKDIPQPWQDQFRAALRGSACPVIPGEPMCAFAWDWRDWTLGTFPRSASDWP
ncbi:hypothetical protein [Burkholderia sp. Bp8998]|uniref:hypothetical protein n=1 Tax=Burkholderia sp. Bp8998 TaxID=2184557 RepID=UPI000F59BEA6|nr:hypothetical protein [Burkholderia sp. Bp8998]RQS08667.1 hypothetical protein DIE06_32975 [Burkholderia sp. Bp8998]